MSNSKEISVHEQTMRSLWSEFVPLVKRICANYESDAFKSQDLFQEIWIAVWNSLPRFDHRCSWKTWIYRVACNTAVSHVVHESRQRRLVSLEEVMELHDPSSNHDRLENKEVLDKVHDVLRRLKPIDRQLFLLYLEGLSQAEISEITGLSSTNISTKISRIRSFLEQVMTRQGK